MKFCSFVSSLLKCSFTVMTNFYFKMFITVRVNIFGKMIERTSWKIRPFGKPKELKDQKKNSTNLKCLFLRLSSIRS